MFSQKIKRALNARNLKKRDFAEKMGVSYASFLYRLKKDDFRESEMMKIADALGGHLEITLRLDDKKIKM